MSFLNSIRKLGELLAMNSKCGNCIFKVVEYEESPCATCKHGKYNGEEKNFVKSEE